MPGGNPVERPLREREVESVADDELRLGEALARNLDHRCARIEADDLTTQVLRQPARTAGNVQGVRGRQRSDRLLHEYAILVPAGPVPVDEEAGCVDPVVV